MTCPYRYPSPEVIEDPFPFYAWLREEGPAHRLENGSFVVSRYDDIVAIVRDPETFSNRVGPLNDHGGRRRRRSAPRAR